MIFAVSEHVNTSRDHFDRTYLQGPHGFEECEEVIYHEITGL